MNKSEFPQVQSLYQVITVSWELIRRANSFFFFFTVLGIELRVSHLVGKCFTTCRKSQPQKCKILEPHLRTTESGMTWVCLNDLHFYNCCRWFWFTHSSLRFIANNKELLEAKNLFLNFIQLAMVLCWRLLLLISSLPVLEGTNTVLYLLLKIYCPLEICNKFYRVSKNPR
jgi:hypothetical protein